ncbi:MAG: phosphodiester glycosidase family protein [Muribaculaceae bacterium]|nr:phosphodiester glycosidase family protein [Muribaculaceae bacterium]
MSNKHFDIDDDEIRIISSESRNDTRKRRNLILTVAAIILASLCGVMIWFLLTRGGEKEETVSESAQTIDFSPVPTQSAPEATGFATVKDTVINGSALRIIIPHDASPTLEVGYEPEADSTAVLAAMAADVRGDNGMIAGAFVLKGNLLSKGQAKSGFCSIINDEVTIGVADATPMLEAALESEGYFFRQYPLVVGGQPVENRPKGKALRKALAETDGKLSVIISLERLTFHDFSQALADLGVKNAIYLVGGDAPVYYTTENGERILSGTPKNSEYEYINYIVWR